MSRIIFCLKQAHLDIVRERMQEMLEKTPLYIDDSNFAESVIHLVDFYIEKRCSCSHPDPDFRSSCKVHT